MIADIRLALRSLGQRPALTLAAIATLTLGLGVTSAMYALVDAVLLRPLPYPEPDRIVRIWERHPGAPVTFQRHWLSNVTLDGWEGQARTIASFGRYTTAEDTVGDERPERLTSTVVSASLFDVLGVPPHLGRVFEAGDEREGAAPTVVLSHGFWQERFGGRPTALGESLTINGMAHAVIGVMPPGFAFPVSTTRFWRAEIVTAAEREAGRVRVLSVIGRLADGASSEAAADEGTAMARAQTRPPAVNLLFGTGGPVEVRAEPLADEMTAAVRPAMLVASAGVGVVLLLACANVAHLLLSRGVSRQREFAVRAALGAGRWRLAREAIAEALLLSLAGGALGILLARALVTVVPALAPREFPRLDTVTLDERVVVVTLLLALAAGVLAALVPAWRASRASATALHDGGRGATAGSARRLRRGLLVAETALASMLLIGALLLARSFVRLIQVDPGFEATGVLTADVVFPRGQPATAATASRVDEILDTLRAIPGVTVAGAGNMAPMTPVTALQLIPLGETGPDGQPVVARALSWVVTPGFLEALGVRVHEGRFLQAPDVGSPTQAFMINEAFAARYWPGMRPPIGRQFPGLLHSKGTVAELVGVAGNVLKDGLDREADPAIFVPVNTAERVFSGQVVLAVRTSGPPAAFAPVVRRIVHDVDSRLAISRISTLDDKLAESVATPRFGTLVVSAFAGLALSLAAIGLFGVLSYGVSEQRRDIGVRAALGASAARLVGMVLREGLVLVALGVALGLAGAAWATRYMEATLFGITALDPLTYAAAPLVLLVVACAACVLPARRAAGVDPVEALRCE